MARKLAPAARMVTLAGEAPPPPPPTRARTAQHLPSDGWRSGPLPACTPTQRSRTARHLTCDARRRDNLPYATPQQLLAMADRDPAGLLGRFEQALEHVRNARRLGPSDLKLRIQLGPFNPAMNPLSGELGFVCIFIPPTESYSQNTGTFSLYAVRPHPSLPQPPSAFQHRRPS